MIECLICGNKLKRLNNNHLKQHKMNMAEYREKYPNAPTISEETKNLISKTLTGRPMAEDVRKRHSAAIKKAWAEGKNKGFTGGQHSDEAKETLRQKNIGKKMSIEAIEKLRQRSIGNKYNLGNVRRK